MNSYKFNISAHSAPSLPNGVGQEPSLPLSTPSAAKFVEHLPFNRGARRPFKQTVALPVQQPNGMPANPAVSVLGPVNPSPHSDISLVASPNGIDKPDSRTVELKYFDDLKKRGTYGKRDGLLHRWTGSHWAAIDGDQGIASAMDWLQKHHPERVNKAAAKSCFESATIMASSLSEQNRKRCIIPLRNVYLEATDKGAILMLKPDPTLGITYALDMGLPLQGKTYTPGAVPPESLFGQFLTTSLPDQAVQDYLQEGMGYTLTPFTIHQIALLLKGAGRNGKSVMVRLLSALHGRTASMNLKKLSGFALSPLFGASLAISDEVPERGLDTQIWKALISGEAVPVDRKYLSPINYRSTAKWVICTNLDQRSNDNSDGFWRRMVVIPFSEQIARKDVVPGLDQKIIDTELRLVLDWCLAGLQRLMARGSFPAEPQAVIAAKNLAVLASDPVAAWIQDCGVQASTDSVDLKTKDEIFKRYCYWCSANRVRVMDSVAFWTRLRRLVTLEPDSQHRMGGARLRCVPIRFESDSLSPPPIAGSTPFDDA